MAWNQTDTDRWDYVPDEPNDDRHILLHGNGTFAELCRDNLHLYAQPQSVAIDPVWPLNEATWIRSERLGSEPETDEAAWTLLAAAVDTP